MVSFSRLWVLRWMQNTTLWTFVDRYRRFGKTCFLNFLFCLLSRLFILFSFFLPYPYTLHSFFFPFINDVRDTKENLRFSGREYEGSFLLSCDAMYHIQNSEVLRHYIHVTEHRNRFFFNKQPDAPIIQIYSVIKLHVSGIFSARNHEFFTVHSALLSFMQVFDDRFQAESGWNPDSASKRSPKTCMKLTSAECVVENSWWWAEKMPETRSLITE